jgi:dipeptidyl aminopeptidase/acylaminoacyl peptidase
MYLKGAGGERPEELLLQSKTPGWDEHWPTDWSSKGIVFVSGNRGESDIWILPLDGDRTPYPVVRERGDEVAAKVSPDAKWIAYTHREPGSPPAVYVRSLAPTGAKWKVSIAGGDLPRWRADGKELFYVAADGNVMAVPIEPDATTLGTPVPKILFQTGRQGPGGGRVFDVSPDGQRFLLRLADDQPNTASIVVVTNWPELLKRH